MIRWLAGSVSPTKADKSEMIRWADASGAPTRQLLPVDGCGRIQRAYIETTMNGCVSESSGITRAAAIVPIPLTAISSARTSLIGLTCLNHSTRTRSEHCTTFAQRSNRRRNRPSYQCEFQPCES